MNPILNIYTIMLVILIQMAHQNNNKHVFYLHGMIIEIQGIHAVSEQFGEYRFNDIIDSLKSTGATVHYEVRTQETDFQRFCTKVSSQVDELIKEGVNPNYITVVGASKGAMMAMNISAINKNPINYVLLGANSDRLEKSFDWTLHGNILGIYEKSDKIAGKDYGYWIQKSKPTAQFSELMINTGLGHGFLYRPIDEWLGPVKKMINR